jgi:hypothetical protein
MTVEYYSRDGKPLSLEEFARLSEDWKYRTVARTESGGWLISTVWLGIDHNFGDGPPVIFETMIFNTRSLESAWHDEYCARYGTEDAAQEGHLEAMRWLIDKLGEDSRE